MIDFNAVDNLGDRDKFNDIESDFFSFCNQLDLGLDSGKTSVI